MTRTAQRLDGDARKVLVGKEGCHYCLRVGYRKHPLFTDDLARGSEAGAKVFLHVHEPAKRSKLHPGRDIYLFLLAALVLLGSVEAAHARTTFLTDEFIVNTHTTSYQWAPAVTGAEDGSFVVVWEDYGYGPGELGESGIVARELSDTGLPRDGEVAISTAVGGVGFEPRIAGNGDRFVVTWTNAPGFEEPAYASADRDWFGVVARNLAVFPDCGDADDTGVLTILQRAVCLPHDLRAPIAGSVERRRCAA